MMRVLDGIRRYKEIFMDYTRETAFDKLIQGYSRYYNVQEIRENTVPILARCEYFEYSEKYLLSKKAKIWEADCEDFLYLFSVEELTAETLEACRKYAWEDGLASAHIGPGHMYSYITVVFLAERADENVQNALKKCRASKSFRFSLHGWASLRAVLVTVGEDKVLTNWAGRDAGQAVSDVLYPKSNKKRRIRK